MKRFRANPDIFISAIQLTVEAFTGDHPNAEHVIGVRYNPALRQAFIETLEGTMTANIGDWIVQGTHGELYPVKDEIFRRRWIPLESEAKDG